LKRLAEKKKELLMRQYGDISANNMNPDSIDNKKEEE
jgi:hypothetical protein